MRFETLCYVIDGERVLLIKKKRGLGAGKVNAPGGGIEEGESPEEAAAREVKEEVGIEVKPEFMGALEFVNNNNLHGICFIFVSHKFKGELKETEEAKPVWFDIKDLPWERMWEDDRYWLPKVLEGKKVYGRFWFKDWRLIKKELFELKEFSSL